MKSLLLKDFYVLLKQMRYMLVLILIFSVTPSLSLTPLAAVYAAMLPYTAMAYDERCKWDQLAAMMPYTPRDLVLSKYLLGWLFCGAASVLSVLISFVVSGLRGENISFSGGVFSFCLGLCMLDLVLPLMFRFGVEKARFLYILALGIVAGALGAGAAILNLSSRGGDPGWLLALVPVVVILLTLLSVRLSLRFYARREF